jgi:hypothetical protein
MRTKTMLARAKKKSKRRETRKMASLRPSGPPLPMKMETIERKFYALHGPDADLGAFLRDIQAQVRADLGLDLADREWYD